MIKDAIIPKFLAFLLEGKMNKDSCYIDGYKTAFLIEPETITKGIKYNLVSGICSQIKFHFTVFLYNSQLDFSQLEKFNSYYYDDMEFNGRIIKENYIFNFIIDKNP